MSLPTDHHVWVLLSYPGHAKEVQIVFTVCIDKIAKLRDSWFRGREGSTGRLYQSLPSLLSWKSHRVGHFCDKYLLFIYLGWQGWVLFDSSRVMWASWNLPWHFTCDICLTRGAESLSQNLMSKMKNTESTQCDETDTFTYFWWQRTLVWLLWDEFGIY